MALYNTSSELLLPERRGIFTPDSKFVDQNDHGLRVIRRGKRFGKISRRGFFFWMLSFAVLMSICLAIVGFKLIFPGEFSTACFFV